MRKKVGGVIFLLTKRINIIKLQVSKKWQVVFTIEPFRGVNYPNVSYPFPFGASSVQSKRQHV
jgi:hypothetical protein